METHFGYALRLRRNAAGLSLSGLSGLVHYSRSYLSRIESGQRQAGSDLARLCDAALDADGELTALVEIKSGFPGNGAVSPVEAVAGMELPQLRHGTESR